MARGTSLKEIEEFPRRIKIFLIIFLLLITFGTLAFKIVTDVSYFRAFTRTLETLAFMFNAEEGIEKSLEVFLAIVGVFLIWWILWSVSDMLLDGKLREYLKAQSFFSKLNKMRGHYIIAGGGRVGEEIALGLIKKKQKYVILERNEEVVEKLEKKGFPVLQGDVMDELVLKKANIAQAKAIMLTLPQTEKNLLVTINAKELNPTINIYARADNPAYVNRLKKAGAHTVIVPEVIAGDKFVEELGI